MFTLKYFTLSKCNNLINRAADFQKYIDQHGAFGCKSYWVMANSGVGATMNIEGMDSAVDAYISNDYLGMSQHEEVKRAGIEAVMKYGAGACAAQAIGGYLDIHRDLEEAIARFTGQEDAIVFSSGFGANAGLLRTILGKEDIAYVDSFIHTSATSGLTGTNTKHVGHNDVEYLDMVLGRSRNQYKTNLVIIDGVYSQNGDLAKLPEIIDVCRKHNVLLMMDDAHGMGVMGRNGRGTAERFGCLGKVDIITGTFSKSFGCVGGFVAASHSIIQYLRYYADSNVFSAAMTPQVAASALKSIELQTSTPEFRNRLWDNVDYLRDRLTDEGFDIGHSVSPIFPIMVRDNQKVYEIARELQKRGIFVSGIAYPAVSPKEARLRVSILATHTKNQLDRLVLSLTEIREFIPF